MSVQVAESYDSTIREPLCDFCGRNAWTVRHRVDCEGDHIYLECSTVECVGSYVVSIGTSVTLS